MTTQRTLTACLALSAAALFLARTWKQRHALDLHGKCVVIFGGSRGLGLVMARELIDEGARVVIVARDGDELDRARASIVGDQSLVTALTCDVRSRKQVMMTIQRIVDLHGVIDVLINDAGIIEVGPFEHMTLADFENAMATHFWGPLHTIQAALPHMRQTGARRIVNISSVGGKIAVPHLLPYCASKFALTGLSEGLQVELAKDGFAVTTVCPGLMRTGSTYNAQFKGRHHEEFAWFHTMGSLPGLSIDARRAARQVIDAFRRGDAELIITPLARCAVALNGVMPGSMMAVSGAASVLLPAPTGERGDSQQAGWQSISSTAPSAVTSLGDRAAFANNELPGRD